jgi:ribosomal protein S18 acetylase RimI-like enzyme
MTFNFSFHSLEDAREIRTLLDWMLPYDLGYANWNDWLGRIEGELFLGYKQACLAHVVEHGDRRLIGYLIHQQKKGKGNELFEEMKSARVDREFQERHVMSFMLKQAEVEARKAGRQFAILDVREEKKGVINLLLRHGYKIISAQNLYQPDKRDLVMVKDLYSSNNSRKLMAA